VDRAQPGPSCRGEHDLRDPAAGQAAVRGADAHDQRPVKSGRRPPVLQIGDDRLADIVRQRQPLGPSTLASDPKLAGAPVDILDAVPLSMPQRPRGTPRSSLAPVRIAHRALTTTHAPFVQVLR